ncbi:MAG TPA: phage baseplate assembly protein V, partial [Acidimicrobiales bacterium]
AVGSLLGFGVLKYRDNLIWFRPRVTAGNLAGEAEVRIWDAKDAKVVVSKSKVASKTATLDDNPKSLAGKFSPLLPRIGIPPLNLLFVGSLGPAASTDAHVVANRPAAFGSSTSKSADALAAAYAEHFGSTFAEAEGLAEGDPSLIAGKEVTIEGVPDIFKGKWIISQARHIFDEVEHGDYVVHFTVSGRHDRSLFGLASGGASQGEPATIPGLVTALVTSNNDPDKLGRVKLTFPWLNNNHESDWARVSLPGFGKEYGSYWLPEVGDEVLVGFEFGDARRPYVLGGVQSSKSKHPLATGSVKQGASPTTEVVNRGFVSRLGHQIRFDDDQLGMKSGVVIGNKDEKISFKIEDSQSTKGITITCDPGGMPGNLTIEIKGQTSNLTLKSGGNVSIESGPSGSLTLKGGQQGITIDATGQLKANGKMGVALGDTATPQTEVKGAMVKLN